MDRSQPNARDAPVLDRRAAALARFTPVEQNEEVHATVVIVQVGTQHIGIPTAGLWGLFENVKVTRVLDTPPWIAGLAQVRGELVTVVHLAHWLGLPYSATSGPVAVLADSQRLLGVLVDEVVGFRDVKTEDLSEVLSKKARRDMSPFSAVTRDLVSILEVKQFLDDSQQLIGGDNASVCGS